jgi:outer membrane receptor protein involved in Fe transport
LLQGKWSRLISNRLFFEVADSTLIFNWPNRRKPEAQGISILNANTGFRYNAPLASSLGQRVASQSNQRGAVSYVTGSHAFKVGFTTQEAWHHAYYDDNGPAPGLGAGLVSYTFLNNLPSSITQFAEPVLFDERLKVNLGLYVQDQWTLKRLTLNLGIRYDYFNAYVPEQHLDAGPFVPARDYDKVECVPCWKDINPRMASPTICSATVDRRSR